MPADQWVGRAQRLFPGLDGMTHAISNIRVVIDNSDQQLLARAVERAAR